jgi:enoyl-CoA hydratase/3-hydroxyacyl-CoA dehydrogenase
MKNITLSEHTPIHPVVKQSIRSTGTASASSVGLTDLVALSRKARRLQFGSAGTIATDPNFIGHLEKHGLMVAGAGGIMGSGIVQMSTRANIPTFVQEFNDQKAEDAVKKIRDTLAYAVQKEVITPAQAEHAAGKIAGTIGSLDTNLGKIPSDIGMVIEAIFENKELKEKFVRDVSHQAPDAIIGLNTSSLSITELSKFAKNPANVVGIHFFKQSHINPFIEIIKGAYTSDETVRKAMTLTRAMGKIAIVCKDSPGFVVNRLLAPVSNEGVRMKDEGLTNETTIDHVFLKTLWPTKHLKYPELREKVLLPFNGTNQDNYLSLLGEIGDIIHHGLEARYGDAYKSAKTVHEKRHQYDAIMKQARTEGWSKERTDRALDKIKHVVGNQPFQAEKEAEVRDRFLGLIFGIAGQLVDEGVTTPEDVDRGVQNGLQWEVGPFEMMNKMGTDKALKLVSQYAAHTPGFAVPQMLVKQAASKAPFALSLVDTRDEGPTRYITINRPNKQNGLNPELIEDIRRAFRDAEQDASVKHIVFEGTGPLFVAGADLEHLAESNKAAMKNAKFKKRAATKNSLAFIAQGRSLMDEIKASKKPTIAKVTMALGGGGELALACDYRVMAQDGVIGFPELSYKIFPAWGGTDFLEEKIGKPLAHFLVQEGGFIKKAKGLAALNGDLAHEVGLADIVVPRNHLDDATVKALADGKFDAKAKPGSNIRTLDQLKTPWLKEKYQRYATASVEDLMQNELAKLDPAAVKLAYRRVQEGTKGTSKEDAFAMLWNMQQPVPKDGKKPTLGQKLQGTDAVKALARQVLS